MEAESRSFGLFHALEIDAEFGWGYVKGYRPFVMMGGRSSSERELGRPLMLEDTLLVLRCRHGSRDAMCRIYLKYKDYLLTLARGLLGEQAAAEDVVHDVFVRFAESTAQFHLTGSLKGYLATCTANLARDRIRARARRTERPEPWRQATKDADGPQQCAVATEERTRLRQALSRIPYEQREAVLLHLKAEMKFKDIARLQRVSLSTTHGRYRYGLEKLRSLLNSEARQ